MFRFLYNHNPFYVISAGFLLYGVKLIFRPGEVEYIDPWHLLMAISCVTLAMASAAFGIVRFGKVWEDARSIILVLLLMFLAISVSFDEILNTHSWEALRLLLAGFVFSVTVSEVLLLGLGIRLPALYRVPYYLFLALFFGYPVWASPEFCEKLNTVVQWRVAFFPTIAAGITLTLIPAIRRGRTLCENNGTPWKWPLYPWCLFGFLGLAVCFRSWSLSISLDTGLIRTSIRAMDSAFGLYLLVPFFLAILFVLMEIALVEKSTKLRRFVLWAAPFVLLVSIPRFWPMSHHGTVQQFLATFVMEVGSPILLAILGLLAFYGIAWLRGIRSAENGFVAMCVAAVFVGPRSTEFSTDNLQTWSLVAMGCLMLTHGLARKSSWYSFLGGSALAIAFGLHLPGTMLEVWQATTTFHLILAIVLLCGGLFKDDFAKKLRVLGAVVLPLVFFSSLNTVTRFPLAFELMLVYGAAVTSLAFGCWHFMKERLYLYAGLVNCLAGTGFGSVSLYRWLQKIASPEGVRAIVLGLGCFVVALFISAVKGGLFDRFRRHPEISSFDPPIADA
jgi:phage-related holin